jgi:hypothetical protein
VGEDGRRCDETGFLELDHVVPVAMGGEATVEGVRVLCRSHNQYEAERVLGREVVAAARAERQMEDDLVGGLRRMGVSAADARHAVAESRGRGTTVEERMRAALDVIDARQKGWRCEEERVSWRPRPQHGRHTACTLAVQPYGPREPVKASEHSLAGISAVESVARKVQGGERPARPSTARGGD